MSDIVDFVSDVTPREREELVQVFGMGEQVRWATRPKVRRELIDELWFWVLQLMGLVGVGLASAMLTLFYRRFTDFPWVTLAFLLLFALCFLVGACICGIFPALRRINGDRCKRLYVLTNHRAIVQEPCRWRGWRQRTFPLHEHMLHSRICRPGGGGDLLFSVSRDGYGSGDQGFIHLPDLQEAHRELNAAIHALMDAAERKA